LARINYIVTLKLHANRHLDVHSGVNTGIGVLIIMWKY